MGRDVFDRQMTELRALDDERKRLLQGVAAVDGKMRVLLAKLAGAKPLITPEGVQAETTGESGEKGNRLLLILAENPRLNVRLAAEAIYGSSGRADCARVRALLRHLKKMGKVDSTERGVWQPTEHPSSLDVAEPEGQKTSTYVVKGGTAFKIPNRTPNGAAR